MNISDILIPERTLCDVTTSSKKTALESLAELIANADTSLSQTDVFLGFMSREKLGSTGLGKGIALPHGRMNGAKTALGAFIRLQQPVDYDANDGTPVDLLFALVVPEQATDEHLQILSKLAQTFSNEDVLDKIRASASGEEIYGLLCIND